MTVQRIVRLQAATLMMFLGMTAFAASAQPGQGAAPDKTLGLGLMVGEPTGANVKYWLSDTAAVDGLVGFSPSHDNFAAHADYLYHLNDLIRLDENRMPVYFGGGPRVRVRDHQDNLFGIRTVAGVAYIFDDLPIDVFFEAGPVFDFTPDFDVRYTVGAGARFWF